MKIRAKLLACVFVSALVLFTGCKDNPMEHGGADQTQGELLLNLATDLNEVVKSEASVKGEDINEYAILISKAGAPYAGFDTYAEMPEGKKVRLYNGTYNLKAYWGKDVEAEFEAPFYMGTKDFEIKGSETTNVSLVCKLANTKITLLYTESFKVAFKDYVAYRTDFTTDFTKSPLVFKSNELRSAYFKASPFVLTVYLTKSDGDVLFYSFPKQANVKVGDHYIVSLRGKGISDPEAGFVIEVNDVTNNIITTSEVSIKDLIKAAPEMNISSDALATPVYVVGQPDPTKSIIAYAKSEAGIKDIVIKSDDDVFSKNGIPAELSLASLAEDSELAEKVKAIGIELETQSLVGQTGYKINFNRMLANLDMLASEDEKSHIFTIDVIDKYDQKGTGTFTLKTQRPIFESPVVAGQLWSDKAYVKPIASSNVSRGDFSKMKQFIYEYSENNTEWTAYTPTSSDSFMLISNLKPNTKYYWRVSYKQFVSAVKEFSTELQAQLPNSGMEEWDGDLILNNGGVDYKRWRVFANGGAQFWGTNNIMTNSVGSNNIYSKNSGTRPSTSAHSGSYAAQIVTVGWGNGNTMVEGSSYVQYNTSPGKLVVGDINSSGALEINGREFSSRPKSFQYWFKHLPYNGRSYRAFVILENRSAEGVVEIGKSEVYVDGTVTNSYTMKSLNINYDNRYLDLPATHIYVEFASAQTDNTSKADTQKIRGNAGLFAGYSDWRTEGSQLFIDDIALVY